MNQMMTRFTIFMTDHAPVLTLGFIALMVLAA